MSRNYPVNSDIRTDLLDPVLTQEQAKLIVQTQTDNYIQSLDRSERLKSVSRTKTIEETYELIRQSIADYETRENITSGNTITFTMIEPSDHLAAFPSIVINPRSKMPGQWQGGALNKTGGRREMKPHIREIVEDPDYSGYRRIITGQWFDHIIEFQCWSLTKKEAYDLSVKFETIMREYDWWLGASGVSKLLYQRTGSLLNKKSSDNNIYAYPVEYYIRTEEITEIREKTLERMILKVSTTT